MIKHPDDDVEDNEEKVDTNNTYIETIKDTHIESISGSHIEPILQILPLDKIENTAVIETQVSEKQIEPSYTITPTDNALEQAKIVGNPGRRHRHAMFAQSKSGGASKYFKTRG